MDTMRQHILVVDDSVDGTDSLVELIALWGYDVAGCYDAATALESASVRTPDAVLLDLLMPGMSGFRFAEKFRIMPHCEFVPLIAITGYSSAASRCQARTVGIENYLVKPADLNTLEQLLVQVTQGSGILPITTRPRRSPTERTRTPHEAYGEVKAAQLRARDRGTIKASRSSLRSRFSIEVQ